ncbi:CACTA en-spm transposon protein [Cucumis melo var. makuwa]|uniref:CACTA en-spm transposon protein n=1 Tax=Cucumis melo var. makuwa TaxID=1194695 RepID=A0A5A7UER0_CUCMM|nr:CACTA en-spm transposon protein [Cucumis melo var. makuwa]TYK14556.1 CACTA en-spm transposon protein [Cucumis melo var. makuwa]
MSISTMSSFPSCFDETDAMFFEYTEDLDNSAEGSSSVGDDSDESNNGTSRLSATLTSRRRVQSRLLELKCYVAANGRILMSISPDAEKPILPHDVHFNQAIGVCVRKTFLVHCLKWANISREYIEVVKSNLQHQMLNTFKEFWGDCHRHFKKYSDPEEACANPPYILVGHNKD